MTAAKRRGGRQTKLTVAKVRLAIENTGAIRTAMAKHLGVARATLYKFLNEHPELKTEIHDVEEQTIDLAEGQVLKAIKDMDMSTVRWFLDRKAKHRGYGNITITGADGGAIQVEHAMAKPDYSNLTLAEKKQMLALHKKAMAKPDNAAPSK